MKRKKPSKFGEMRQLARAMQRFTTPVMPDKRAYRRYLITLHQAIAEYMEKEKIKNRMDPSRPNVIHPLKGKLLSLTASSLQTRADAVKYLGDHYHAQAVPVMAMLAKDPVFGVRLKLAEAFSKFKDERTVKPLLSLLKDPEWEVRKQAAVALGSQGDLRAVEPLIEALKDKLPQNRCQAAFSLGLLKDKRATRPLIEALKDIREVKLSAVRGLGLLGDRRAVKPLRSLLAAEEMPPDALPRDVLKAQRDLEFVAVVNALGKISFSLVSGEDRERLQAAKDFLGDGGKGKEAALLFYLAAHPKELKQCPLDVKKDTKGRQYLHSLRLDLKRRPLEEVIEILKLAPKRKGKK